MTLALVLIGVILIPFSQFYYEEWVRNNYKRGGVFIVVTLISLAFFYFSGIRMTGDPVGVTLAFVLAIAAVIVSIVNRINREKGES